MPWLRRLLRLPLLVLHLVLGAILTALLFRGTPAWRSARDRRIVRWWLSVIPAILGIRISVHGRPGPGPVLLTAPHLSWLDIPVLGGVGECVFLSKEEVRHWPLIGWLAARSGTLFIGRGRRESMEEAVKNLSGVLDQGGQVLVFPEGTTTSGTLRRFKGRLLQAAIDSGTPVQPVMLRYPHTDGTHPLVPFVGDAALVEHIWALSAASGVEAEVVYLQPITTANRTPGELARAAEYAVRLALGQERAA